MDEFELSGGTFGEEGFFDGKDYLVVVFWLARDLIHGLSAICGEGPEDEI